MATVLPPSNATTPWYHRWWGMALIALGALTVAAGVAFGWYVWRLSQTITNQRANTTTSNVLFQQLQAPGPLQDAEGSNRPALGAQPAEADVTIVEFLDFTCPICRAVYPTVREIAARYPERVRIVSRHFPILSTRSQTLAAAAECAYQQGKYWNMHDQLFQTAEDNVPVADVARRSGLNMRAFNACVETAETAAAVRADLQAAQAIGARGTPTFVINGHKIDGGIPRDVFLDVVAKLLE